MCLNYIYGHFACANSKNFVSFSIESSGGESDYHRLLDFVLFFDTKRSNNGKRCELL